jgi:predicted RNase H-like HicB family nuclease
MDIKDIAKQSSQQYNTFFAEITRETTQLGSYIVATFHDYNSLSTFAESEKELWEMGEEAVIGYFEACTMCDGKIPSPENVDWTSIKEIWAFQIAPEKFSDAVKYLRK